MRSIRKMFIHIRGSLKIIFLLVIAALLIIGILSLLYKPAYGVTLNGEFIGYTENKSELQNKINEYMKKGDGGNTAFVDIEILPEYSFCFLKRETEIKEEEILAKVKNLGTTYYEYYAIVLNNKEKNYVETKADAEKVITKLKDKESSNIAKVAYTRVYNTELKKFTKVDSIVTALYEKATPTIVASSYSSGYATSNDSGKTGVASSGSAPKLGISLIRPTSGIITARFAQRGYEEHTGLDIAGSYGTSIKAVSGGTVTFAGWATSGYGLYVKIDHGNGVETVYAHCSKLYVSKGDKVAQGQKIAAMGSTGRSTGNHLHLEIRKNGISYNPQNYLYK